MNLEYAPEWDTRNRYPSKGNQLRHKNYRQFFQNQPENVVSSLPTKPEIRRLVKSRVNEIIHDRDPGYRNPVVEAGWDQRGPIHTSIRSQNKYKFRGDRRLRDDPIDQSLRPVPPKPRPSHLKKNARTFATPGFLASQTPSVSEVSVQINEDSVGQIEFLFTNGELTSVGGDAGESLEPFVIPPNDYLISVGGTQGERGVGSIQFRTSSGEKSEEFGNGDGEAFLLEAGEGEQVIGVVREADGRITALATSPAPAGKAMGEYSKLMKSSRRTARKREMSSIEIRERATADQYHSYWRTNETVPRQQRRRARMAQTSRRYGERHWAKPKTKAGDWDNRFHVMVSKDNTRNHSAFREYFDAPRHFVAP